jgi:hypothetical protein
VGLEHGLEGQGNPVCVASSESANRGHAAGDGEMGEGGRVLKVGIDIKMLISHTCVDPTAHGHATALKPYPLALPQTGSLSGSLPAGRPHECQTDTQNSIMVSFMFRIIYLYSLYTSTMTSTRLDHDSRARRIAAIRFPLAIFLCSAPSPPAPGRTPGTGDLATSLPRTVSRKWESNGNASGV